MNQIQIVVVKTSKVKFSELEIYMLLKFFCTLSRMTKEHFSLIVILKSYKEYIILIIKPTFVFYLLIKIKYIRTTDDCRKIVERFLVIVG